MTLVVQPNSVLRDGYADSQAGKLVLVTSAGPERLHAYAPGARPHRQPLSGSSRALWSCEIASASQAMEAVVPKDTVTLREVARAAGVHPGTASRALNEDTRALVRSETVERIVAAATSLGYKPNLLARSFKTRRTRSAGIVIPDINNPLFPPIVRGIEDRLFDEGYVALLANTENDPDRQRRIFEGMADRRVDGLVLATARRSDPSLAELAGHGIPIVLINRVVQGRRFSSVSVDDAAGVRMVVEHLRALGHERIGHIAGPQTMSTGFARYRGFLSSMAATGVSADPRKVACADAFTVAEGERCGTALLAVAEPPTAIVAANDMLALGCCSAAATLGLRCPDDVSIVGFNDMPFIDRLDPPLTTVRIPHYELGARAAELLLDLLVLPDRDGGGTVTAVHLAPELVVRGSTAAPPAAARGAPRSAGAVRGGPARRPKRERSGFLRESP